MREVAMVKSRKITEYAYAKINLYLDVTGVRPDGYHDIVSIMQTVGLCDRLDIVARRSEFTDIGLSCNWAHLPTGPENLVWRAAERFCEATGIPLELDINLEKHIPSEAGLAGGSADAAAVLRALRREFAPDMPVSTLVECAASLGSDIPFCLGGGAALCTGRGEIMTALDCIPQLELAIVKSSEKVSTGRAYKKIDSLLPGREAPVGAEEIVSRFCGADVGLLTKSLYNIFEEAVLPDCPLAASQKQALISCGALGALMSGSGSAVFGIFENAEKARSAAKQIGENAVYASTVSAIKL